MSDDIMKELNLLAAKRVTDSMNSVLQLMPNREASIRLQLFVVGGLCAEIARQMQEDRPGMPEDAARAITLSLLSELLGVGCEMASEELVQKVKEAKREI